MKIIWHDWIIEDFKKGYGYVVKRRVGDTDRWKNESYHAEIKHAVEEMLKERIRTETADCIVATVESAQARVSMAMLVKKIDAITADVLEGLDGAE